MRKVLFRNNALFPGQPDLFDHISTLFLLHEHIKAIFSAVGLECGNGKERIIARSSIVGNNKLPWGILVEEIAQYQLCLIMTVIGRAIVDCNRHKTVEITADVLHAVIPDGSQHFL